MFNCSKQAAFAVAVCFGLSFTVSGQASAVTLSAGELLSQFNLITTGDVTSTVHSEGRALIGGNLSGSFEAQNKNDGGLAPSAFDDLIILGNQTGTAKVLNNGTMAIGGTFENIDNLNVNSPARFTNGPDIAVPADFAAILGNASADIAALGATHTPIVSQEGKNQALSTAAVELAVFEIGTNLLTNSNVRFAVANNLAATNFINVFGSGVLNITAGFTGGGLDAFANKSIWNFVGFDQLNFQGSEWFGSILAKGANITQVSNFNGSVFAASAVVTGEYHNNGFTGTIPQPDVPAVPLPASVVLLLSGIAGLGLVRRRARFAGQRHGAVAA